MIRTLLATLPPSAWFAIVTSIIAMIYVGMTLRSKGESLETYTSKHVVIPILIGGCCWIYLLWIMIKL